MIEGKIGQLPSQNLVRQVNIESPWRHANFWKPIILDAVTIASALGVGYAFSRYLENALMVQWLLVALGLYASLSALHVFFTKTFGHRFTVLVLEAIGILVFFYRADVRLLGIAAAIIAFFCSWGYVAGMYQLDNGLDVKFFRAAAPFLRKFTTAMVLALIVIFISQRNQDLLFVSKNNFQVFFDWVAGFANRFYPEVTFNASWSELARSLARLELNNSGNFKNLPASSQEPLLLQAAEQITTTFSNAVGKPIAPDEPTGNVVYDFIVGKLQKLKEQFKNWFVLTWALVIFLVIRGFGLIFYWLAAMLSFVLYQILLASGFIHIIGESRTHEVIVY